MGTIIGSLGLAFLGRVRARRGILIALLLAFCSSLIAFAWCADAGFAFALLVAVGALSTVFETLINTAEFQLRVVESFARPSTPVFMV